jgi:hypothetical protein
MREIFIKNDTLDELRIFKSTTSLGNNFNEIKVDIFSFKIGNVENGLKGQISIMSLALTDNLGSKGGHSTFSKVLVIIFGNVKWLLNLIELGNGDIASFFKSISDLKWMNTFIEKLLGLLKNGTS